MSPSVTEFVEIDDSLHSDQTDLGLS